MKTIALLTCERLPDLNPADQALIPLFAEQSIKAVPVIWKATGVRWGDFSALVVRNTWDYYKEADAFGQWLEAMERAGVPMFNPVHVVKDNMHKFYLKRFREKGVTIIPTLFSPASDPVAWEVLQAQGWDKIVIKPAISAGSFLTQTYTTDTLTPGILHGALGQGDWLIQPYLPEIITEGELSMIFFNGIFSHAVLKKPAEGDFRVQRQYGGRYQRVDPTPELLALGRHIATLENNLLYARVDGVMIQGKFHLMELELIEPDLYFEFGEDIRRNFVANAVEKIG